MLWCLWWREMWIKQHIEYVLLNLSIVASRVPALSRTALAGISLEISLEDKGRMQTTGW